MRKIVAAFAVVLLITVLDVGAAFGDTNGTNRPYSDMGSASLAFDLSNLSVALAGTRNSTHLGLATSTASNVSFSLTLPYIVVTFDDTIVAANGDELYTTATAQIDATNILLGNGEPLGFSDVETITGGTGRFVGASGSFTGTGSVNLDLSTFTGILTFTDTGTISY